MSRVSPSLASDFDLAPVGRETVQARVHEELRRALIGGRFAPGQGLTIRALADQLATSTMPVRDALGRLVAEQALELSPTRQVRVPAMTLARIEDLLAARSLIEGEAVALAAGRIGAAALAEAAALAADGGKGGTDADVARNHAFHFALYAAAGSPILLRLIEGLWLQSGPCTRAAIEVFEQQGGRDAARFHRDIVEALRRGDAVAARAALLADIARPFDYLRARLSAAGTAQ